MCLGDGSHGSSCGETPQPQRLRRSSAVANVLSSRLVLRLVGWLVGWCRFVETCCDAYQVLRENRDLFIGLFSLMLSTGIPELQCAANPNTQPTIATRT